MADVAKEYGTALFTLACEENAQNEYAVALDKIKKLLCENPEYQEFLSCPSIPLEQRLYAIETAFADSVPEKVLFYMQLLCEKGRIPCFLGSAEEYMALLDASRHVSNAVITSAQPLTDEEKSRLLLKLESVCKGKVNARYFVDPALLGGITVELDGKIMDGSLRHRLREIKEVINT